MRMTMTNEEHRPTEGFFACGPKVAREIEAALRRREIDQITRPLIESAVGVDTTPGGGKELP
jgi:hypothetical protein